MTALMTAHKVRASLAPPMATWPPPTGLPTILLVGGEVAVPDFKTFGEAETYVNAMLAIADRVAPRKACTPRKPRKVAAEVGEPVGRPAVVSVRVNGSGADGEVVRLAGRWLTEPIDRPGSAAREKAAMAWRGEHLLKVEKKGRRPSVRLGASTYAADRAPAECAASCMCRVPGWTPEPCRPAPVAPITRSAEWTTWYKELASTRVTARNECAVFLKAGAGPAFEKLAKKRAGKTKG